MVVPIKGLSEFYLHNRRKDGFDYQQGVHLEHHVCSSSQCHLLAGVQGRKAKGKSKGKRLRQSICGTVLTI